MNLSSRPGAFATGQICHPTNKGIIRKHFNDLYLGRLIASLILLIGLFSSSISFADVTGNEIPGSFDCLVTGSGTTTATCAGSSSGTATITLTGDGSGAPGTYTLDGGAPQSFSSNPFTITGLSGGDHTIIATVTAGACVSSPILITVATNPLPTITAAASPAAICTGASSTLTANGASTYTWNPGSLSGTGVAVSPTTTTTYTVTGISAAGCTGGNIWASISAGGTHNLAIKTDGTLWAWGYNLYGQLGDGTAIQRTTPVQIGTATNWLTVSAGNNHSLALKTDGTLWAWGYNGNGMLGDGTVIDKNIPTQIGVATNWSAISAAGSHSIGMRSNGTIWAWGYNNYGQLGDATFTQRTAPVQIGLATNWSGISAASDHSMALKTDGTLWTWGRNTNGQLGDGTVNTRNTPGQVGTATDWAKINACYYHSMAIKTNGTLWSWGNNIYGQIGDGTTTQRNSPIQVGVATNWTAIEGGIYHSVALKTNGTAWAWGLNVYGQLGDGTTTQRNNPVQVGIATNWGIISGGIYHTEGLRIVGSLWSWGYNTNGQLGDGTLALKTSPLQIGSTSVSVTVTVNALPTVSFSGLASSYCQAAPPATLTGSPSGGTFSGPGIIGSTFAPSSAGIGTHSITYSYTDVNGCSNSSSQSVSVVSSNPLDYVNLQFPGTASFCQGGSLTAYGQFYEAGLTEAAGAAAGVTVEFGYSTTNSNPATWINWQPASFNVQVGNNDEYMSTLTLPAGTYYYTFRYLYVLNSCGYQYGGYSAGGGNSWDGTNYISGVLTVHPFPTVTVNPSATTICNGSSTTLTASGASTYLWMPGALTGTSITVSPTSTTTYTVVGTSAAGCVSANAWATNSAGAYHNLGIKTNGTLWAGGENAFGQLGDGTTVIKLNTLQIGTGNNWASVSAGSYHSLAIKTNGTLWAWGQNTNGQVGDGTTTDKTVPVQIGLATNWAAVSAGGSHSIAIRTDGTIWGWGQNSYGQVGDGTFNQRTSPVQIGTATNWASISSGGSHSTAIKKDGTLWAWGRGTQGQVGDGTATDRLSPVQIGTGKNWRKVAACFFHSIAIKTDGTLWTWGRNVEAQIGDGTTTQRNSPLQIGAATNWVSVDGSYYHSMGLRSNGTLWAWGGNNYGQLGDGTLVPKTTPTQTGTETNWLSIDGGIYHTVSIKANSSFWAWGRNMEGQLGNGLNLMYQTLPDQIDTSVVSVIVTVNPLPLVSFSGLAASYCTNSSAATLTGSPAGGTFSGPGISGNTFDPAVAGVGGPYNITYTYIDGSGCTNSATQATTVNGFAGGSVSFSGLAATYCSTDPTALLTGNQAGGTFSGAGITDNGNGTANFSPALAASGTHSITYTYSNGTCSNSFTANTTVLPDYTITATAGANGNISPAGITTLCSGTNQTYTITADVGYSIADVLVDGNSQGAISTYPFTNVTTSHTISASFVIDCISPSLSSNITGVTCNGGTNGAIDLVLTGGAAPFTYSWTGPGGFTSTTEDLAGIIAGSYTVIVTATGGCTSTDTYTVNEPEELELSCSGTNVTCNGFNNGTASVSVTGGTGTYTYSWTDGSSTGGSVSINASKDNNIYANSPTNSNALGENLAIGQSNSGATHRALMAFNISGNMPAGALISSATLTLNVSASAPGAGIQPIYLHKLTSDWGEGTSFTTQSGIGTAATINDATWSHGFYPSTAWGIAGGDFNASVSAVTNVNTPGLYTWSSAGMVANIQDWLNAPSNNYGWLIKGAETASSQSKRMDSRENSSSANVPVLDINYTLPTIVGTSNTLSNLPPGSYTVTVTDANGCSATCTYTVTEPDLIIVTATPGTIVCNGGTTTVTVTATGGSGNYTGTGVFTNVGAGTHTYTVTDDNSCTGSTTITITEPSPLVVSFTGLAGPYCLTDPEVTLTGSPAGGVFSGQGIVGNTFDPAIAGPGIHNITYTYSNGTCSNSSTQQVTVNACGSGVTVNLKLFLQGYYIDGGIMQPVLTNHGIAALPNETDSITVELHDAATFALVESKQAVLLTDGTVSASFTQPAGSYYIAIKHRHTLQTWSANPVACTASTALYDFSNAATMAMGDNQVLLQTGTWGMYTGDINQDEYIDGNDFPQYDFESASGGLYDATYTATDMNGDGFVDGNDFPVYDLNSSNGVSAIHP